jgi:hypothetical protein
MGSIVLIGSAALEFKLLTSKNSLAYERWVKHARRKRWMFIRALLNEAGSGLIRD